RGSITTRKKAKPAPEVRQPSVAGATLPQRLKAWWNGRTPLVQRTTLGGAAAALIVLGIIVLFPTPHGTIQIDIEDPSLSARFDGNMVTFDNAGTPIRVTSTAKRTLEVLQNGIAIDAATKELTIRRGEQRIVTLKLLGDDVVLDGKRIAKKTTAKAKAAEPGWQGWPADAPPPAIAPFDAAEAKARQAAWGKYLGTKVLEWNSVGMGLVLIPPGTFVMGSPAGEVGRSTNEDQTTVTLTQPIYVGKTEVTQGQWMATMASQPWKDGFDVKEGANYPATFVSWEDANAFCEKLSSLEGVTYRLLSDAEWEYACRAGTTSRFSFGDNESQLGRYEWYRENAFDIKEEFAHQVAMKVPNSFGLHDMHGNVSEFCQDLSVEKLPGGTDPLVTSGGVRRITRGGTWWRDENSVYRSSTRRDAAPDFPISTAGFRVARVVPSTQRKVGLEPGVIASAPISNNGPPQNELPPLVSTRWNGWPTDAPPPAIAPFDAVQAKAHQVAWAKYLGVKVVEQNSVGMDMVLVPPGSFKMGESVHASNVQVSVMLTKPISVAMTEVTQAQWSAIMGTQPWKGQANINEGTDYAATYVNWTDAEAYCTKLSSTEGATYRLLTEAEWEFACRAGTVTLYSFGDDMSLLGEHAWFNENASKVKAEYAHLVGLKTPNPFGLKDLHGNVWEWCRDSYEKNIPGGENPLVSSGDSNQVIRGGCWFHHGGNCRSACRGSTPINSRYSFLGFRVARVLSSTELDGKHGPSGSASKNFEKRAGPLMEKNGLALIPAQKSSRFPIVHYAEPPNSPQKKDKPAVVVACDSDPQITTDQPCHDSLRLLTASGVTIWEHNGLNICPTIGGTHQIAIDLQRNRIYVNEMATHRIVAFDMQGNRRWHLEQVRASAVALDEKTGNIWCCRGKDLSEGETVAFDPQGVEVAAYSSHGFDMIYDRYTDGFWLAGKSVTKLDRNGISQFQKSIAAWACLSVSVNTNNGRVWIVERSTPNITTSKNRLWSLNSDGTVHREWDFGKLYLFSVSCVPKSGDAWVSFSGSGGIRRVSPGGQMGELLPLKVTQLSVSPTTSEIWTATSEAVLKLNANGKVLLTSPLAKPCGSVWLQAF
ncbi:MAG: hypothetical protein JWN70_4378, partial [Planctomycetaceae bacterium]|nr:hypothetical protein [Planctomycetaceae bacterium]